MNILSLFDGMSCGQQALERAGIKVDNYFASEIDKYAIQVTMANYPNTKQLGSVIDVDGYSLPKIDLLIGGSPCQSFSFAGKRKGMSTKDEQEILTLEHYLQLKEEGYEFEGQSYLFWEYMRLLNECKPKYFLLENVMMGEKWEKILSKAIGVNGIHINSALVSAQNRKRIYWFGQIRERLFFNDNYCYICTHERKNERIQGKSSNKGTAEILGKTQRGQINMQNLQQGIFENKQEGDNQNLFNNLSNGVKEIERQKQGQDKTKNNTSELHKQEQRTLVAISKGLQKDSEGQRNCEKSGRESIKENSKNNENSFTQRVDWSKKEANKRAVDYHIKYGKEMCCMQCGKKLDYRPYSYIIERGDKSNYKSSSALSEVQFNEARQNNGRVFDILEIGIKGIDSLFGETIINIPQPKDKGILLKDILESQVDEKYYLSDKMIIGFERHKERHTERGTGFKWKPKDGSEKGNALRANAALCPTYNTIITNNKRLNETLLNNELTENCLIDSYNQSIHNDKSITISTRVNASSCTHVYKNSRIRRLTPIECERLQTVADNYTNHVSDSQRYKMLGNGWTVSVIAHIFSYI
jgi:site-specific DNA-cytosine methylase